MFGFPRSILGKLRTPRPTALNMLIASSPRKGFHQTQAKISTATDASGSPMPTARDEENKKGDESDINKGTTDSDMIDVECILGSFKVRIEPEHREKFLAYLHGEDGKDDGESTGSTVPCNSDCGSCKTKSSQTGRECGDKVENHDVQKLKASSNVIGVDGFIGFTKPSGTNGKYRFDKYRQDSDH
jgi:hypothetical protein